MSYLNWSLALKTKSCLYWHEWWAFQSIAVQAVDWHDDHFHYSFPPLSQEGVLGSKNLLCESCLEHPKSQGRHISKPRRPFWGPLAAILDFARRASLQAVSECPPRR